MINKIKNYKKMKGGNRKMSKKQLGILMLGVLAVALLSFAIASSKTVPFINANECTADELCEMKSLYVSPTGFANIPSIRGLKYLEMREEPYYTYHAYITPEGMEFYKRGYLLTNIAPEEVRFSYLADPLGNSSAYLCVDFEGRLYRSKTPCV